MITLHELESHWIDHCNAVKKPLSHVLLNAAKDLENGDEAAISEAIELLRVMAYRSDVEHLTAQVSAKMDNSYREEIDTLLDHMNVNGAPWWKFLLLSRYYRRMLEMSITYAKRREQWLQEKLVKVTALGEN